MSKYFRARVFAAALLGLLPVGGLSGDPQIHLRSGSFDPLARGVVSASAEMTGRGHFIVQFPNPVGCEERRRLEASGLRVLAYLPDNAFLVASDGGTTNALATGLGGVKQGGLVGFCRNTRSKRMSRPLSRLRSRWFTYSREKARTR